MLNLSLKNSIKSAKSKATGSGKFDIHIDKIINQYSDSKFTNDNLKKCSRSELAKMASQVDDTYEVYC